MPLATVEEVLRLYQETYFDLNIQHFHEKLREEHQIELSYTVGPKSVAGSGAGARSAASGGSIVDDESAGRCPGCCSISMAANTNGSAINVGMT